MDVNRSFPRHHIFKFPQRVVMVLHHHKVGMELVTQVVVSEADWKKSCSPVSVVVSFSWVHGLKYSTSCESLGIVSKKF